MNKWTTLNSIWLMYSNLRLGNMWNYAVDQTVREASVMNISLHYSLF